MPETVLPPDFDGAMYLGLHPDVAASGMDPAEHYVAFGHGEGRRHRREDGVYDQDGLRSVHDHSFMEEPGFKAAYARGVVAAGQDYCWHWRVHVGLWAASMALKLDGDFVECGVNRGFLSSAIMQALNWNSLERTFFLLDTFGGIDAAQTTEEERNDGILDRNREHIEMGFYTLDVASVRANFAEWRNVRIIPGTVPDTLDQITSDRIAFASIDMNCAPPELAAMEFLWDRLVPGAVALFDDYAYRGYSTQKRSMDGFAAARGVSVLSLPTGQGLLLKPPTPDPGRRM